MRSNLPKLGRGAVLVTAVLAACTPDAQNGLLAPSDPNLNVSVVAKKTATGFREQRQLHDWSLTKTVTPPSAHLAPGASATFTYTLTATRTSAGLSDQKVGVRGEICVTNPSTTLTISNIVITDDVEVLVGGVGTGTFVVNDAPVSTASNPELVPGEVGCYPYEFSFTPVAGATYWNEASISGTNMFPSHAEAPFTLPVTGTVSGEEDESATLADLLACPTGFSCAPAAEYGSGNWVLTGSSVISYNVVVTNTSAPCSNESTVHNSATLTESDSGDSHNATGDVILTTPDCTPPGDGTEGCTPGYWKQKQHFGNWVGYNPIDPNASRYETVFGVDIFSGNPTLLQALGTGGGGANRFGRHTTAALLNAASADVDYGFTVADVIAAVQAAVASGDLDSLSDKFEGMNERGCPLGRAD